MIHILRPGGPYLKIYYINPFEILTRRKVIYKHYSYKISARYLSWLCFYYLKYYLFARIILGKKKNNLCCQHFKLLIA